MSGLSIGSSSSKAGLFVRTKDERSRDVKDSGKRTSYEMEPRKRERRDSVIPKAASPTDLKSASRGSDRGSSSKHDRIQSSKQDPTSKTVPKDVGRSSPGERRHRSEKPDSEHDRTDGAKHDRMSNADPREDTGTSTSERRRRTEKPQIEQPQRKRRPSERNDRRSPAEPKTSSFFGSIFRR
ncbi:hypothetical protein AMS68_006391 [Peltaster fructicola]|uniref:Uncharacterized protein n=1 Tax=Peltaster fructicola TaxID=286661 RepID=A0A6H0Y1I8_9PEZI|nr:hypothetical protein AMS68_006391 [Peltaster fructicola]